MARRILEGLGFDVAEAADGVEALEQCARAMPDLVLLDWHMPVMDGMDFMNQLRDLAGGDRAKVLFCSAEKDPANIARALTAGADDYVMKPFDGDILHSKLDGIGIMEQAA